MHGRYPLPPEGALSECPSRSRNGSQKARANLEGWRVGNQKGARPSRLCAVGSAMGSAQSCLIEPVLSRSPPPYPPPPPWELLAGVAAARLAARCAAGEGGPIGLTCGPVGRALVRAELGYPHAAPLDGLEVPRAVPANSYMITALRGCGDRAGILLAQITAITCGRVSTRVVQTCAVTSCSYACHRLSTTYTAPPPPHPPPWKSAAGVCECLAGRGHSLEGGVHTSRTYQSKGLIT
jgi:hypothetical protein